MSNSLDGNHTCGTCKYRGEEIEAYDDEGDDMKTGYFLCDLIKHTNGDRPHYTKGLGAGVKDGSGYYAALCVESDFGCNRWEAK